MQTIAWCFVTILAGYLGIMLLMYLLQSKMIYHPQKTISATPSVVGIPFEDVNFRANDGVRLHGWFVPADSAGLTILFCHGNAGNIAGRLETIQLLYKLGLNVFIFDYRGYGKSGGTASEAGTYRDARAAWRYLVHDRNVKADNVVIMGRSLGGAIAAWLAARENPSAVIIESTFTSVPSLAADLYPWLPARLLSRYSYNTAAYLEKVAKPILFVHSKADQLIPYRHGRELYERARKPKAFLTLDGSHGTGFMDTGNSYTGGIQNFLAQHTTYSPKAAQ